MARDLLAYGQQTTTVYARRQCPCASLWRYAPFCHDPFAHRLSCFPAQPFLAVNNTRNATGYKLQSKSTCFTAASLPFLFCQFIYMQEVAITSQTQAAFTPPPGETVSKVEVLSSLCQPAFVVGFSLPPRNWLKYRSRLFSIGAIIGRPALNQ